MGVLVRVFLFVSTLFGFAAAIRMAAWPLVHTNVLPPTAPQSATRGHEVTPRMTAESLAMITYRNPFRITRRPARVSYDPVRLVQQLAPPPPRPALNVVGIAGGAIPSAVVEAFPGSEGSRLVSVGDVVAGLRVKEIGHNRVVIVGMDTMWVLQVREPWRN
jgi:hypothetical protein